MKTFKPIVLLSQTESNTNNLDNSKTLKIEDLPLIRTSTQRLVDAENMPDIKRLMSCIWQTNELHILFADTGVGKSIFAVALADALSKGNSIMFLENDNKPLTVLYYDFELSDRQFYKRYTNSDEQTYNFSERFHIDTIVFAQLSSISSDACYSEILFKKICFDIEDKLADILVIDNISYLDINSTQDKKVGLDIMRELIKIKKMYNISILVLAHTPKCSLSSPITINDLAGSKSLSNFADSVSAIGKSAKDSSLRYIKQVKPSRSSEMLFDINNVIVCRIIKDDCFLGFEFIECDSEFEHLKELDSQERQHERMQKIERAKELRDAGKTISEIAFEILGSAELKGTISKWLNK